MEINSSRITSYILDVGQTLLQSNAEVSRVEDTIRRMGYAYGFRHVDVLTIMNCIVLTIEDGDGQILTQTRRILSIHTNMERIRACNALSRRICAKTLTEAEFAEALEEIAHTKEYSMWQTYAIYMITAASMAVLFGGDLMDFFAAAVAAAFLRFVDILIARANVQNFVTNFIESLAAGVAIILLLKLGFGHHYDKVAMGNIMLLISGSGLMTSVRDMINNDLISGVMGFLTATIGAAAIALGFVAATGLIG